MFGRKKETSYDYYKRQYESYLRESGKLKKPHRSICLLLSFLLGAVYFGYLVAHFGGGLLEAAAVDEWATLGTALAGALVLPHIVLVFLAVLFTFFGWLFRNKGFALTGAILYAVAGIAFTLYFVFIVVQMVLSFVGFALMNREK